MALQNVLKFDRLLHSLCLATLAVAAAAPFARAQVMRTVNNQATAPSNSALDQGQQTDSDGGAWAASGVVTEAEVDQILQIIQRDPEGAQLVTQATNLAQETSGEPFWKMISLCPQGTSGTTLGVTNRGQPTNISNFRMIEELTSNPDVNGEINEAAASAYYQSTIAQAIQSKGYSANAPYDVLYFADMFLIKVMSKPPGICLQGTLSVNDAVPTLFHEMVHYTGSQWSKWIDMTKYKDESDYELQTALSPSDETDAYIAQWSYLLRNGRGHEIPELVRGYFDDKGSFQGGSAQNSPDRLAVAELILQGQIFASGEGYHSLRYLSEYANLLNFQDSSMVNLYNNLQNLLQNRQDNLPYYNQQSSSEYAEDQQSIQRIPGEVTSCNAKIGALNTLVSQFNSQYGKK